MLRDGRPIGTHRIDLVRDGDEVRVTVAIDLVVRIALVPVYRYTHRNREVWRAGRLQSIDAATDDDGRSQFVRGRAVGDGFQVEASAGSLTVPADVIPTSYWRRETVARDRLLDTQSGRLLQVAAAREPAGDGTVRYRLTGDLRVNLWYDAADRLLRIGFELGGARFDYAPLDRAGAIRRTTAGG
ncbi:MAG: DUF6134 family protein [Alphaproteobacteria bacterium]